MSVRVAWLEVDSHDPRALAEFWMHVLGYRMGGAEEGEAWIEDPAGKKDGIWFSAVPEGKSVKNRLHLDLRPSRTRDEEVERLKGLGATVLEGFGGPEATWTVMQDPEGNEFCVLRGPGDPVPPGGQPVDA
jgi:predicted enzyme related to lactoylglutathione lyase